MDGRFSSAQIVWQRHLHELELTSYEIDLILSSIPINACTSSYAPLLRDGIVPFILKQPRSSQVLYTFTRYEKVYILTYRIFN